MVDLDQLVENKKPKFGELKLTIAQFFRINGGTTQLHGVKPDIAFPTYADENSIGESGFDNALPWMQINPARSREVGTMQDLLPTRCKNATMRVSRRIETSSSSRKTSRKSNNCVKTAGYPSAKRTPQEARNPRESLEVTRSPSKVRQERLREHYRQTCRTGRRKGSV